MLPFKLQSRKLKVSQKIYRNNKKIPKKKTFLSNWETLQGKLYFYLEIHAHFVSPIVILLSLNIPAGWTSKMVPGLGQFSVMTKLYKVHISSLLSLLRLLMMLLIWWFLLDKRTVSSRPIRIRSLRVSGIPALNSCYLIKVLVFIMYNKSLYVKFEMFPRVVDQKFNNQTFLILAQSLYSKLKLIQLKGNLSWSIVQTRPTVLINW